MYKFMYNEIIMSYALPISEARTKLPELVNLADSIFRKTYITVKGNIKAVIVSAKHLDLLEETLEVLSDTKTVKKLEIGQKQVKNGDLISYKDLKIKLGI